MKTGFRGTFVISWSQTEIDGLLAAPVEMIDAGAVWYWHGEALRVDGPTELLRLGNANGESDLRRRAAHSVRRLVGAAVQNRSDLNEVAVDDPLLDKSFVVTNGVQSYTVTLIEVGDGARPLLMFVDEIPPRATDLWVVHHSLGSIACPADAMPGQPGSGVICFTRGTKIATPSGPLLVEDLREGDRVQTRDNGACEIQWIGARRISGARLFVVPKLRPVRICVGALGIERPEKELLVSPEHRMLLRGPQVQALFNTPEVLVAARDLINGRTIVIDSAVPDVTYIHLLLGAHQVLWANGVESESFHPASAAMSALDTQDRIRLNGILPQLEHDPHSYGAYARRNLSSSEAAILRHEAA
jgi:hypothetical protein